MKLFKLLSIALLLSFGIKGAEQKEASEGIVLTRAQVEEGLKSGQLIGRADATGIRVFFSQESVNPDGSKRYKLVPVLFATEPSTEPKPTDDDDDIYG